MLHGGDRSNSSEDSSDDRDTTPTLGDVMASTPFVNSAEHHWDDDSDDDDDDD